MYAWENSNPEPTLGLLNDVFLLLSEVNWSNRVLLFPEKEAKSVVPLRGMPQTAQQKKNYTGSTI
jgi:hypothetical protein